MYPFSEQTRLSVLIPALLVLLSLPLLTGCGSRSVKLPPPGLESSTTPHYDRSESLAGQAEDWGRRNIYKSKNWDF